MIRAKYAAEMQHPSKAKHSPEETLRLIQEQMKTSKPVVSLVVCGHVDSGKSTLVGRLLLDLGLTCKHEHRQNVIGARLMGKQTFELAWTTDQSAEERQRGITIDVAVRHFETPHRRFTLLDTPGHADFVSNMIAGAAQADVAILVLDAGPGGFEKGFSVRGQTREHALLVRALGIQDLIVVINKMGLVKWSEDRFEEIQGQAEPFFVSAGFHAERMVWIPVSAIVGDNVVSGGAVPWCDQSLADVLDVVRVPERTVQGPLRIAIQNNVSLVEGHRSSSVISVGGRILSGVLCTGQNVLAIGSAVVGRPSFSIRQILGLDGEPLDLASAGDHVELRLSLNGGGPEVTLSSGVVLCDTFSPTVPIAVEAIARIVTFENLEAPILQGTAVELNTFSQDVAVTITKLLNLYKTNGEFVRAKPRMVRSNQAAEIRFSVQGHGIALDIFKTNKNLGRVLFRRDGQTIAAGVIEQVFAQREEEEGEGT